MPTDEMIAKLREVLASLNGYGNSAEECAALERVIARLEGVALTPAPELPQR